MTRRTANPVKPAKHAVPGSMCAVSLPGPIIEQVITTLQSCRQSGHRLSSLIRVTATYRPPSLISISVTMPKIGTLASGGFVDMCRK